MEFGFTAEQESFRQEVRRFLQDVLTPEFREALKRSGDENCSPEFSRRLSEKGWIGLNWPPEYGGLGKGAVDRFIFNEELVTHDAPVDYHFIGERQVGPSLMRHGSEEQKRDLLPKIARAEISFCLGLSEPEAGSDLANVQTRAVRNGDYYIVNGQKIWTSHAHSADICWLVVRTDPDAPKHRGISILMVDMKSRGIDAQPLVNMAGTPGFSQVFFEDVQVPAANLVGQENTGWYIIAEHLDFERAGIDRIAYNQRVFEECLEFVRHAPTLGDGRDRMIRQRLAELYVELQVGRLLAYRVAWLMDQGVVPNAEVCMSKVFGSEWCQRMANTVLQIASLYGAATPSELRDRAMRFYLVSAGDTIRAGTSEIQRNVIAQRGLALPRG
ncbi:MAG: acyl-CoA dehydrogenase family protein [Dehalococcoidia bacterium]